MNDAERGVKFVERCRLSPACAVVLYGFCFKNAGQMNFNDARESNPEL